MSITSGSKTRNADLNLDSLTFSAGGATIDQIETSITNVATRVPTSAAVFGELATKVDLPVTEPTANQIAIWTSTTAIGFSNRLTWDSTNGLRVGDIAGGDFAEIQQDGSLYFYGDATVFDDVAIDISSVKLPAAGAPTWTAYKGGYVLSFAAAADNTIYFTTQIPHGYKPGSNIGFHLHVVPPTTRGGNVKWTVTYSWADINEAFPTESSMSNTLSVGTTQDVHLIHDIGDITGTGMSLSSVLICSLTREGTDAGDDFPDPVYLVSADFHVEFDTIGSRQEYVK